MNDYAHNAAVHLGRTGGKATSEAKAEAARKNGRKGGRPRRIQRAKPTETPQIK